MAEVTGLKDIQSDLKDVQNSFKKVLNLIELRHAEYLRDRDGDSIGMDRLKANVGAIMLTSTVTGSPAGSPSTPPPLPFQIRNVKLDSPRFDGSDMLQWIFKAEQFFKYYNTPDVHHLIAAMHMEKEVVPRFQMLSRNHPFQSWLEFGPSPYESARASLFKLQHTTAVSEYYLKFTALANRSQGVSAEALLDYFISGLKPDIRRDVIAQTPINVPKAFSLVKLFEEKYNRKLKSPSPTATSKFTPTNYPYTPPKSSLPPLLPTPPQKPLNTPNRTSQFKRMSLAEAQLRQARGLCYTFDKKISINHKCPNRTYLLSTSEESDAEEVPVVESTETELVTEGEHHLSFNALKESSLGTLHFQGSIQGVQVQILLDSSSSDNFLQPRIANCLKLPIQAAESFKVLVGNGNSLTAEGFVENLEVHVQGHTLQLPVYLLPVTGADLVLGATWLATLGPHIADLLSVAVDSGNVRKKTKKATTSSYQGKSLKRFSCGICFDSVTVSNVFTNTSCNHPFCIKCISKYVKLQINKNAVKVTCPNPECSVELKSQHLQTILPKELIVEWESAFYESSISLKQKIYCPYKNCSLLLVNDGVEVVTSCECPSCHRLFCAQCKVPWHGDMNCLEFRKSKTGRDNEKQLDLKFLELANTQKWQRCPKCSMHVQKNGGCEHISCRCGCNFCYKCGKYWNKGHICNTR